MPTYEYQCDACAHNFDEFQAMKDEPLKKCPKCGKKKLKRLIGAGAGLIFRGSGFYITDYRSDSYKSDAKADQDASKPADTSKPADSGKSADTSKPAESGKSEPAPAASKSEPAPKSKSSKSSKSEK